jgi:hypothetical protein
VRVVIVRRRRVHSAQVAGSRLLSVAVVICVGIRRKQSLLLASLWTLQVAHLHIIVLAITGVRGESRERIFVVSTLWCFVRAHGCAAGACAS